MPVHPRAAIPHDHPGTPATRTVAIDGVERSYMELFRWIALAGVAYLPSTVVPVGTSDDGLPIGVQIVGPYLHDRTTLGLAGHIEALVLDRDGGPLRPRPRPLTPRPLSRRHSTFATRFLRTGPQKFCRKRGFRPPTRTGA